jgi:hypothetical protein
MNRPRCHRHALASVALAAACVVFLEGCTSSGSTASDASASRATIGPTASPIDRLTTIPADAVKMTPQTDRNPVHSLSAEFTDPVPMPGAVNTAGYEDGSFVLPDGKTFYFFFTPDADRVPPEKQLLDGVTGLYVSTLTGGLWSAGTRVVLQDQGKLALDGCEFILDDVMWFCTTREGLTGLHWFTARFRDGRWQDWQLADFDPSYEVGELHISRDGKTLYFHSERAGGKGSRDIWVSTKTADGRWGEPSNLAAVNSSGDEGWPALSPDETELWFNRDYYIWRSRLVNGQWQPPEKIFGPLAGEPTLDEAGNVYFIHHYFDGDQMIEADVYVSHRKRA